MDADPTADMQRKAGEIQRLAAEAEGEAVSEDGKVRVVAGAAGNIKVLDLRLSAFELSGVELGEVIVETIKAAERKVQADLSAEMSRIMGVSVGEDVFGGGLTRIEPETEA
ncbi:YbaB/EbfC family nucleoid-associated protein [Glycomyces sp. NPDC048151]|uniref:YbaB/EbfC family nucleoid-associated protein n=1 Tax=Glycomyces sp. NPDC048151 TaxID=3364002 RepID=UPI003718D9F5